MYTSAHSTQQPPAMVSEAVREKRREKRTANGCATASRMVLITSSTAEIHRSWRGSIVTTLSGRARVRNTLHSANTVLITINDR